MKKITFLLMSLTLTGGVFSQATLDSVEMGASYSNQMYYKLIDGAKTSQPASEWHLGFSTNVQSVTIITNAGVPASGMGATGMSVSVWPNGTNADFATVDTAGFYTWPKLYNDSLDQELGALNQNSIGGMDYGWGKYNISTHQVLGDSVYIIKIGDDCFKLDIIKRVGETYTFRYANVSDNSEGTPITINAITDYGTKYFVFYNLVDGQIKDIELADWDLWAVKYHDWYNNSAPDQAVTGILVNPKWDVAIVDAGSGNQSTNTDFSTGVFENKKNNIGQHYKWLNQAYAWEVTDAKVYYLKNAAGEVWKWYPTYFGGAANGKTRFYKEQVAFAGVETLITQFVDIYPNPVNDQLTVAFEGKGATTSIIVRNQMGQTITSESINTVDGINQHKIDLSSLSTGMYFVELVQNGLSTVKSIVKN